ncbi:MAG: hypothetical protein IJO88_04375 [Oscillospiraceae bacterium]|nr:hypothetical protein [Oscillospiraceae bacterium]
MAGFEEGYKFFTENASAYTGAMLSDDYIAAVNEEIEKLLKDLNSLEGFKTASKVLKGDAAEFWHTGTFNIDAALKDSQHRASVDRSHDFASTDITTNFGDRYGLKYYSDAQASAKAQSVSIFQRYKDYQGRGGTDSLEKYLIDRGYSEADTILSDPIYAGQIRIIPRDQLEDAVAWLERMIKTEAARRPEQIHRYEETLALLSDRLKDNNGVESIPLSREEAEQLASLAKRGGITADELGLTTENLMKYEYVLQQAFKAGLTAATITLVLKVAPEVYKAISYLIENGEIDKEQFKRIGFAAVTGSVEGFVRGSVSAALTTCCKAGLMGEFLRFVDPTIIGTVTVLTMNVMKNAGEVALGRKTRSELTGELVKDMYISACSLIVGGIGQALIEVPIVGYMLGSFLGSLIGTFTYNVGYKTALSFCVDSGFTMFGSVEQDYKLPKELLKEIGIDVFDYETFEFDTFEPDTFMADSFDFDSFVPNTLGITFLRRGVIGVNKVGYMPS